MEHFSNCIKYLIISAAPMKPNRQVAIYVQKRSTQSNRGVISFQNIITEVGGSWNRVTHTFRIPVPGMYFFSLTVMKGGTNEDGMAAYIRRDTDFIQKTHSGTSGISGSASVLLELNPNNQLFAWLDWGTIHSDPYTHFNGFLLFSDV